MTKSKMTLFLMELKTLQVEGVAKCHIKFKKLSSKSCLFIVSKY